jgi:ATP-binding protein involved in chromosome partitioning
MAIPFLGRIPIDPKIVDSSDNGFAYIYDYAKEPAGEAMQEIVDKIIMKTEEKRAA